MLDAVALKLRSRIPDAPRERARGLVRALGRVESVRWDAQGNLWSVNMTLPLIVPEAPGVLTENFATFDLNKSSYSATLINGVTPQMKIVGPFVEVSIGSSSRRLF